MIMFLDPRAESAPYASALRAGASLEAAIERARTLHEYGGVDDLAQLAAAVMWSVTRTHALIDGNKRASVCLADRFLAINAHHLAGADDQLYDMVAACARGALDEATLAGRIRALWEPGAPGAPFELRYSDVMRRLAA